MVLVPDFFVLLNIMNNLSSKFSFISLNTWGLKDSTKRKAFFILQRTTRTICVSTRN